MWTARADVGQLLDRCAALAYIEQYIEGRRDISEDDRDALWLYVWSRSRAGTSLAPRTREAWTETEKPLHRCAICMSLGGAATAHRAPGHPPVPAPGPSDLYQFIPCPAVTPGLRVVFRRGMTLPSQALRSYAGDAGPVRAIGAVRLPRRAMSVSAQRIPGRISPALYEPGTQELKARRRPRNPSVRVLCGVNGSSSSHQLRPGISPRVAFEANCPQNGPRKLRMRFWQAALGWSFCAARFRRRICG
jgi:hypothetical protein